MSRMRFKQITDPRGGQSARVCPQCGAAVIKGTFAGKLSYKCRNEHIGPWDDTVHTEKQS